MRRKGETLTEFLTAATVFGMMMAGIFEFIANHTETLADIRNKDELMYHAQRFAAVSGDKINTLANNYTCKEGNTKYTLIDTKTKLIVTILTDAGDDVTSMSIALK